VDYPPIFGFFREYIPLNSLKVQGRKNCQIGCGRQCGYPMSMGGQRSRGCLCLRAGRAGGGCRWMRLSPAGLHGPADSSRSHGLALISASVGLRGSFVFSILELAGACGPVSPWLYGSGGEDSGGIWCKWLKAMGREFFRAVTGFVGLGSITGELRSPLDFLISSARVGQARSLRGPRRPALRRAKLAGVARVPTRHAGGVRHEPQSNRIND